MASIGKMGLCVKVKRAAAYGGSGLMYRLAGNENTGVGSRNCSSVGSVSS